VTRLYRKGKAILVVLLKRSVKPLRAIASYAFLIASYALLLAIPWVLGAITASRTDLVPLNPENAAEWLLYLIVSTCFGFAYLTLFALLFVWLYPRLEGSWTSFREEIREEEVKIIQREERSTEAGALSLAEERREITPLSKKENQKVSS